MPKYWLLKTEPESFSIQDLAKAPQKTICWDGVRNYQARNYLRRGASRANCGGTRAELPAAVLAPTPDRAVGRQGQ